MVSMDWIFCHVLGAVHQSYTFTWIPGFRGIHSMAREAAGALPP